MQYSDDDVVRFVGGTGFIMEPGKATINDVRNVTKRLDEETRAGGLADPARIIDLGDGHGLRPLRYAAWDRAAVPLSKGPAAPGYRAAVERFYLTWWNAMTRYQLDNPSVDSTWCYRAHAGLMIAVNRWAGSDYASAVRWCALAHLADRLDGDLDGAAEQMLVATLGVPSEAVDDMSSIAADARRVKGTPAAMPEILLLKVLGGSHFSAMLRETPRPEHELNPALFNKLRTIADDDKTGSNLELLVAYLVSLLPGYRPKRNTLTSDYACENDVIAALTPYARPLVSDQPSSVLIECKNWKEARLGSSIVGYFYSRMAILGCRFGLLVSQQGVTRMGVDTDVARPEQAGEAMIRRLFHETGRVVLSLDAASLRKVSEFGSFLQIIREKYEDFVFGSEKRLS